MATAKGGFGHSSPISDLKTACQLVLKGSGFGNY